MSEGLVEEGEFSDIFDSGQWVELSFVPPSQSGSWDEAGAFVVGEISGAAKSAWLRGDGWPGVMSRLRDLAEHLGGSVQTESLLPRSGNTGAVNGPERHFCKWDGPEVDI